MKKRCLLILFLASSAQAKAPIHFGPSESERMFNYLSAAGVPLSADLPGFKTYPTGDASCEYESTEDGGDVTTMQCDFFADGISYKVPGYDDSLALFGILGDVKGIDYGTYADAVNVACSATVMAGNWQYDCTSTHMSGIEDTSDDQQN